MLLTREQVALLAKESLREVTGLETVSMDTEIRPEYFLPTVDALSSRMGLEIIMNRNKPHKGWRVSTVVGFVFNNQVRFELLDGKSPKEISDH